MWLTIDIGNTNTSFGIWEGKKLKEVFTLPTEKNKEPLISLKKELKQKKIKKIDIQKIIIASVVPQIDYKYLSFFKAKYVEPVFMTALADLGLKIKYNKPEDIGADRIANAYAVTHFYQGDIVVIDFGTAITFDVITSKKEYIGGLILPGLETAKNALVAKASLLYDFELKKPKSLIANTTCEAMRSGIYYGYVCLVKALIQRIKQELKSKKITVVLTGGQADFVGKEIPEIEGIEPNLVHLGLKLFGEKNEEKV